MAESLRRKLRFLLRAGARAETTGHLQVVDGIAGQFRGSEHRHRLAARQSVQHLQAELDVPSVCAETGSTVVHSRGRVRRGDRVLHGLSGDFRLPARLQFNGPRRQGPVLAPGQIRAVRIHDTATSFAHQSR